MNRPTKSQMEWLVILVLLIGGTVALIVENGLGEALLRLLSIFLVVVVLLALLRLARKVGR